MYSFTLTPKVDTPAALKHYAQMHKVKPGWLFLTGSVEDIETVRRKLGYVDPDPKLDKELSNHIGVIKYGNEPLERWGGCPGMSSPEWIAETLSWVDWPMLVVNHGDSTLMKVSPSSGTVVATYITGKGPFAVVVGGGQVWVSNFSSSSVSRTASN